MQRGTKEVFTACAIRLFFNMASYSSLPYRVRADMFSQLAALEKAGLPGERAWSLLKLPGVAPTRLQSVHNRVHSQR